MRRPAARLAIVALAAMLIASHAMAQDPARFGDYSEVGPQDPALEARTSAVAATLRCPVCQGESIQDSPSELARQMRAVVRDQLREGRTADEVRAYFVSKYGEWILLEPAPRGMNLALYAFPVLLVVGGLLLVGLLVRRWTAAPRVGEARPVDRRG